MLVASGRADFTLDGATSLVPAIDSGRPFVVLAGVHGGCYELFASGRVRAIKDLKGKSIAIGGTGAADHVYISSMMAYVGMDPRSDVKWIDTKSFDGPMELFVAGKADAFLGFPTSAATGSRQKSWTSHCQHGSGRSVVAAFLLHAGLGSGVRAQASGCHQAGAARHSQGRRRLCAATRARRTIHRE